MFDERQLNTLGALEAGILGKPAPDDIAPDGIKWERVSLDFDGVPDEDWCKEILASGKGLDGNGYYGLPRAWPETNGKYAVDCLQYRERTVEKHGLTIEEAIDEFIELAEGCRG